MNTQTRIKLKGLKIYTGMSQETVCFNATVLFDGLSIGTADNDGHGGETRVLFEPGKKSCSARPNHMRRVFCQSALANTMASHFS